MYSESDHPHSHHLHAPNLVRVATVLQLDPCNSVKRELSALAWPLYSICNAAEGDAVKVQVRLCHPSVCHPPVALPLTQGRSHHLWPHLCFSPTGSSLLVWSTRLLQVRTVALAFPSQMLFSQVSTWLPPLRQPRASASTSQARPC